jgi:HK97 gp10 family phage protein
MKFSVHFDASGLIHGLEDIVNQARAQMRPAVEAGGAVIEAEARLQVPVREGHLRDAIHVEADEESQSQSSVVVVPAHAAGNEYGIDPAYARRIEFGFVGADRLGRVYNQAANPFMRTAGDIAGEAAAAAVAQKFGEGV